MALQSALGAMVMGFEEGQWDKRCVPAAPGTTGRRDFTGFPHNGKA